jgi:YegS/Rv2252/BmrU family lipid kinase
MKILFIVNPTSEKNNKLKIEEIISEFAGQYKFSWEIYYTREKGNDAKIRDLIARFQPGLAIVSGGDGTINLVGKLLLKSQVEMGIIPAGSANGLAYNLHMPNNFRDALHKILNTKAKPFDIIRINQKYLCLHLGDVGINAQTVKRFEREKSKGIAGYGKHMAKEFLAKQHPFSFQLFNQGHRKKYKAEMLVLANAKAYGTGAIINPDGKPDDGKFEIIIIKPYPWWSFFRLARMLFIGKNHHVDFVKVLSTSKAVIQFSKPQDLQVDGEMIEAIPEIKAEILSSALQIRY